MILVEYEHICMCVDLRSFFRSLLLCIINVFFKSPIKWYVANLNINIEFSKRRNQSCPSTNLVWYVFYFFTWIDIIQIITQFSICKSYTKMMLIKMTSKYALSSGKMKMPRSVNCFYDYIVCRVEWFTCTVQLYFENMLFN